MIKVKRIKAEPIVEGIFTDGWFPILEGKLKVDGVTATLIVGREGMIVEVFDQANHIDVIYILTDLSLAMNAFVCMKENMASKELIELGFYE